MRELFDAIRRADHDVDNWLLRSGCEGILVLLEGHVPGEELPDLDL